MEPIRHEPRTWYFCDPEKNTECTKTFCAYKPDHIAGCFATSKKDCARTDFNGEPCVVPKWVLDRKQKQIFCAFEEIKDVLHAICKTVFHKHNAGGR